MAEHSAIKAAATINQIACPMQLQPLRSAALVVVPSVLHWRDEGSGKKLKCAAARKLLHAVIQLIVLFCSPPTLLTPAHADPRNPIFLYSILQ